MKTTQREKQRENKQEDIKKSKYSGQERQSAEHAGKEYKRFELSDFSAVSLTYKSQTVSS